MKKLTLLLSLICLLSPSAWAGYQISGTISAEQGQKTEGINVVLIEQNPNKPPQGPIAMAKVGKGGVYQLEVQEVDSTSQYMVGTRLGEVRAASKPFKIDQPKVTVDVVIEGAAAVAVDSENLLKGPFVFAGTVRAEPGFDASGATIQLIQVPMDNPKGKVIAQTVSDEDNTFSITLDNADKHSLYVVAAAKGVRMGSSDSFPLQAGFELPPFDLEFLQVTDDPSHFAIKKNLYYFELMPEKVQVTELLLVETEYKGTLDLTKKPFVKQLPIGATNFQVMRAVGQTQVEEIGGKAIIAVAFNYGRGQIYFSYDLPPSAFDQDLLSQLLPRTEEVDLVRTSAGFDVKFLGSLSENVIESKKSHGQEVYFSKRALVLGGEKEVKFNLNVELIPQKRLFYPATLLMVLLLSGLFWYVKVKPERK